MKYQEKKYRVDSFTKIQKILDKVGAKKNHEVTTTHYYAPQESNDILKLVKYVDKNEIHILKDVQGKVYLKNEIPVESTEAGLRWLKNKGYEIVNVVKMVNTDYEYKNGIVGLYVIDDFLYSVILDFPDQQQEEVEKELKLETAEIISVPYNKFLEKIGRLRSMKLD